MGGGRGFGGGGGCGRGGGMGRGGGRGMGQGRGRGQGRKVAVPGPTDAALRPLQDVAPDAARSEPTPLDRTEPPKRSAQIDPARCAHCGACAPDCPEGAIRAEEAVTIDASRCTGCGACVDACPNEAISLVEVPVPVDTP